MAAPVHVALTAATLSGNHGAEAMLLATVGRLRELRPGVHFHVFTYAPTEDRVRVDDPLVTVHSLTPAAVVLRLVPGALVAALLRKVGLSRLRVLVPRDVRALAACRLQVDLAGISFAAGRERFLPYNVLTLVPAFLLGVPVVKGAQALGPFPGGVGRRIAAACLGRCVAVFARGEETRAHLEGLLGPHPAVRRADDVAFLLQEGDAVGPAAGDAVDLAMEEVARRRGEARSVVGVCPSSLLTARDGEGYPELVAGVVTSLVAAGDLVVLFPHATRGTPAAGPRNNDLWAMERVLRRLPAPVRARVVTVPGEVDATGLLRLAGALDLAVVSRFHAMIAVLSRGCPAVVVGWSHKYREVMARFGLAAHAFDADGASVEGIQASLDAFRRDLPGLRRRLLEHAEDARRSAAAQIHAMADRLHP